MKAFLMYKDQDFDLQRPLPPNVQELTQDLELNTLFNAMALGDPFLLDVIKKAVFYGSNDLDTICYRQDILRDCLKNPAVIWEIYQIPIESVEKRQRNWLGIFSNYPSGIQMYQKVKMEEVSIDMPMWRIIPSFMKIRAGTAGE